MFALIHFISGTGTSNNKRVVLGNTLPEVKKKTIGSVSSLLVFKISLETTVFV